MRWILILCLGLCAIEPDFTQPVRGSQHFKDGYNDLDVPFDMPVYDQLMAGGVDDLLAKHFAHLFIRDPLVVFKELLDVDDFESSDHFEVYKENEINPV
jgi:glutamate--cysteine ligase catalytic subunit